MGYLDLILPSKGWNGVLGPHTTFLGMEWGIWTSYYPLRDGMGYLDLILPSEGWNGVFGPHTTL